MGRCPSDRSPYGLTKPCKLCPFRTDLRPYLSRKRAEEIAASLVHAEFPCHETTGVKTGMPTPRAEWVHCAGALIVLERMNKPSQMMRVAERLGVYDRSKLDMAAPVHDDLTEWVDAHDR